MFLKVQVRSKIFSPQGRALFTMMCPGISYSTVHSLMFHSNGSVQNDKLYRDFCNKHVAHFSHDDGVSIGNHSIDAETSTLLEQPDELKFDDKRSPITMEYEVITIFMDKYNISATWEFDNIYGNDDYDYANTSFQLKVGSYWCQDKSVMEFACCPPM